MPEEGKKSAQEAPKPRRAAESSSQVGKAPSAADHTTEAVHENFDKAKENSVSNVEKIFSDRISAGSEKLDPRALRTIQEIYESQKLAVASFYDDGKQEYEKRSLSVASEGIGNRTSLAEQLLKKANDESRQKISGLEAILKKYVKDTNITTNEVYEVYKAVIGFDQICKKHPELNSMVEKLGNSRELADEDYNAVVKLLNPATLNIDRTSAAKSFEATAAGAVINLMRPDQRFKLIQVFMESGQKGSTQKLMQGLLANGVINRYQAEQLMKMPQAAGVTFTPDFKEKLARGYFAEQSEQVRAKMQQEVAENFAGSDARNIVDKFVGDGIIDSPLVHFAMMAWGAITTGLNLIGSLRVNWEDIPGTLKDFAENAATNPYIYIGTAAMGVGYQGLSGNMDSRGFMGGDISGWLESLGEADKADAFKKNGRRIAGEIYLNSPKDFAAYIDAGGFQTMMDVKAAKVAENKSPFITIGDLIGSEEKKTPDKNNPGGRLRLATSLKSIKDVDKKLNYFAESAVAMNINSTHDMDAELSKIKTEQTSAVLAPAAPATPSAKPRIAAEPAMPSAKPRITAATTGSPSSPRAGATTPSTAPSKKS